MTNDKLREIVDGYFGMGDREIVFHEGNRRMCYMANDKPQPGSWVIHNGKKFLLVGYDSRMNPWLEDEHGFVAHHFVDVLSPLVEPVVKRFEAWTAIIVPTGDCVYFTTFNTEEEVREYRPKAFAYIHINREIKEGEVVEI
jgi:hypothetical protein